MIREIIQSILGKGKSSKTCRPPEFRLMPDEHGTYSLYKWSNLYRCYQIKAIDVKDEEEGKKLVANLKRGHIDIDIDSNKGADIA